MKTNTNRLPEALHYAATLHADDVRKGTPIPYISHLLAVAGLVLEHGGSNDAAIAGLLHDALEDAEDEMQAALREAEIDQKFGPTVLAIVKGCTDGVPNKSGEKPPWKERKQRYLEKLPKSPSDVLLVSCCDKLHNARAVLRDYPLGETLWRRFKGGREGTLWYYRSLATIFELVNQHTGAPPTALVRDLDDVVTRIEVLHGRNRFQEMGRFPKPVPNNDTDSSVIEVGWAEGELADGRPYHAACWAQDGVTMITLQFSSIGMEEFTKEEIETLLEEENIIRFDPGPAFLTAHKAFDVAKNLVWTINMVVGDQDRVFAKDNFRLRPYSA